MWYWPLLPPKSFVWSKIGIRMVVPIRASKSLGEQPLGGLFPVSEEYIPPMMLASLHPPALGFTQPNPPGRGSPDGPVQSLPECLESLMIWSTPPSRPPCVCCHCHSQ